MGTTTQSDNVSAKEAQRNPGPSSFANNPLQAASKNERLNTL